MNIERFVPSKIVKKGRQFVTRIRTIDPNEGIILGKTAIHEAKHLVLLIANGIGAKSGTIVGTSEYNGMVEPNGWDPIAAIGPDADGDSGGSHDRRLVILHGHDVGTVGAVARSMLRGLKRKVNVVAGLLERKRTISGYEAEQAMKDDDDPMEEIETRDGFGIVISMEAIRRSQRQAIVFDQAA